MESRLTELNQESSHRSTTDAHAAPITRSETSATNKPLSSMAGESSPHPQTHPISSARVVDRTPGREDHIENMTWRDIIWYEGKYVHAGITDLSFYHKYPKAGHVFWWWGTDALTLDTFPPGKWYWYAKIWLRRRKLRRIVDKVEHWVVHEVLIKHLVNFGIEESRIKVVPCPVRYKQAVEKRLHKGFNILYLYPEGNDNPRLKRWKYGIDIIQELKRQLTDYDIRWICANGKMDLNEVWGIVDFYLRPSRHDGDPRMVKEAMINGIPYYYREDFKHDLSEIKKILLDEYEKKMSPSPSQTEGGNLRPKPSRGRHQLRNGA